MDDQLLISCDVAGLTLTELVGLEDSALGDAVRRMRRDADRQDEVLSGFAAAL